MMGFAIGSVMVPLVDQALKFVLLRRLRSDLVSLGPLGHLRLIPSRIWLARAWGRPNPRVLWSLWFASAAGLLIAVLALPTCGVFAGLLLGGSFSHAVETTQRRFVYDYVCLRFWPAFNVADVAIALGVVGLAVRLLQHLIR